MSLIGLQDGSFLNAVSQGIAEIFETARSALLRSYPLVYLDRLKMMDAEDGELYGRFVAKQYIADIITENAPASVYKGGYLELAQFDLGKIKIGTAMNESELAKLDSWTRRGGLAVGEDQYSTWLQEWIENLLLGVLQRQNWMAASMFLDDYSYNRWQVKFSGNSSPWACPADLKVTVTVPWSNDSGATGNASATPIKDIQTQDRVARITYGMPPFDRITMSSAALQAMVHTNEFRDLAFRTLNLGFSPTATSLALANDDENLAIMKRILNKEIVIDDASYVTQGADGADSAQTRYIPENKVILDRTTNTNRDCDFGNGVVTESLVASMTGLTTVSAAPSISMSGTRGPIGYVTAPKDLNPPSVTGWAVARCWPRRHKPECSSVLTVW